MRDLHEDIAIYFFLRIEFFFVYLILLPDLPVRRSSLFSILPMLTSALAATVKQIPDIQIRLNFQGPTFTAGNPLGSGPRSALVNQNRHSNRTYNLVAQISSIILLPWFVWSRPSPRLR